MIVESDFLKELCTVAQLEVWDEANVESQLSHIVMTSLFIMWYLTVVKRF